MHRTRPLENFVTLKNENKLEKEIFLGCKRGGQEATGCTKQNNLRRIQNYFQIYKNVGISAIEYYPERS